VRAKGERAERQKKDSCSLSFADRGERGGLKRQKKKKKRKERCGIFVFFFFWLIGLILQWILILGPYFRSLKFLNFVWTILIGGPRRRPQWPSHWAGPGPTLLGMKMCLYVYSHNC
jgi:hypothetical protein